MGPSVAAARQAEKAKKRGREPEGNAVETVPEPYLPVPLRSASGTFGGHPASLRSQPTGLLRAATSPAFSHAFSAIEPSELNQSKLPGCFTAGAGTFYARRKVNRRTVIKRKG